MFNLGLQMWGGRSAGMASGGIWYVTSSGSAPNGSGTLTDPWQTFASIDESVILPGHILDGSNDTYVDTLTFGKSGELGKSITIRNITATEITSTFDYLTIYNCSSLIDIDGDNCVVWGNSGSIECSGVDNIVWKNNSTVWDTGTRTKIWYNSCIGGADDGIHCVGSTSPDIRYNYCSNNVDDGIVIVSCTGSFIISHNIVKNINSVAISIGESDGICSHNLAYGLSDGVLVAVTDLSTHNVEVGNNITSGTGFANIRLVASGSGSILNVTGGYNILVDDAAVAEVEATLGVVNYTGTNDSGLTDPLLTPTDRLYLTSPCLDQGYDAGYTQGVDPDSIWPLTVLLEDYTPQLVDDPGEGVDPEATLIPNNTGIHIGPWSRSGTAEAVTYLGSTVTYNSNTVTYTA